MKLQTGHRKVNVRTRNLIVWHVSRSAGKGSRPGGEWGLTLSSCVNTSFELRTITIICCVLLTLLVIGGNLNKIVVKPRNISMISELTK